MLQSRAALVRVFEQLRPGAPVAAGGGKLPGPWLRHTRGWVRALHAPFVADFTGFDKPWRLLAEFVPDLQVHEHAFGAGYLARGHYAPANAVRTHAVTDGLVLPVRLRKVVLDVTGFQVVPASEEQGASGGGGAGQWPGSACCALTSSSTRTSPPL